jgi:hypothetical protein
MTSARKAASSSGENVVVEIGRTPEQWLLPRSDSVMGQNAIELEPAVLKKFNFGGLLGWTCSDNADQHNRPNQTGQQDGRHNHFVFRFHTHHVGYWGGVEILMELPLETFCTFPRIDMRTEMVSVFVLTIGTRSLVSVVASADEGIRYVTAITSVLLADSEYWMESNTSFDSLISGCFAVIDARAIIRIREESTLASAPSAAMAELQSKRPKRSMIVFIIVRCLTFRPNVSLPDSGWFGLFPRDMRLFKCDATCPSTSFVGPL